jgi:signal transduction histidine kinase
VSAKLLIVEDEAIIALEIEMHLKDFGYEVVGIAADADEALRLAAVAQPDLALLDIVLRGERDGVETSTLLREQSGVPVIYLTGHSDPATLNRAIATGAYGYLLKPYRPEELRAAVEVALAKHAIEQRHSARWRELAAALQTANERERTELANRLHEQIAQEVAAARYVVSTLPRRDAQRVMEILELLGSTTEKVTGLANELRPTHIGSGLLPALDRFAFELFQDTPVQCEVSADDLWVLDPLATPLFRIAEAALINVKLHANASKVHVELRERGEEILLRVSDDGQGFSSAASEKPQAFGFERMRRWVNSVGGTLQIDSSPGQGTVIEVTLKR